MAVRFQRRIKIAPGVRLNVSKSGVGLSAGPRGATISAGRTGVYGNAGIPGTGLSYRKKLKGAPKGSSQSTAGHPSSIQVNIDDEGQVTLCHSNGESLTSAETTYTRKHAGSKIRAFMDATCEQRNETLSLITELHHLTPRPTETPEYYPEPFRVPKPTLSLLNKILASLIPSCRRKAEKALADWESDKQSHETKELERKRREEVQVFSDINAMQQVLETYLGDIEWPVEPTIDFDLGDNNKTLALDILFPNEENMPDKEWSVPATQYKLTAKKVSATKRRQFYRDYIHSVMMRVVGEVFAHLPTVNHILISGYRVIVNASNGQPENEYIVSAIVNRTEWTSIDFSRLRKIEPTEVFTGHQLVRSMTKTGIFKGITPFAPDDLADLTSLS